MTSWTLIICEGAHDQAVLSSLARVCGDWKRIEPKNLPTELHKVYPKPKQNTAPVWISEWQPDVLMKNNHYLVIRNLGGAEKVMGENAVSLYTQFKPAALGVVVDANGIGVANRESAFRNRFRPLYSNIDQVRAGCVFEGNPRMGLWVSPNNKDPGSLTRVLYDAAKRNKPFELQLAESFIQNLKMLSPNTSDSSREKAILGALCQSVAPGASLAVALNKAQCWFDLELQTVSPYQELLKFIDSMAGF